MNNLGLKVENSNFSSTDAIGESLPGSIRREEAKTSTGMMCAKRIRKQIESYTIPCIRREVKHLSYARHYTRREVRPLSENAGGSTSLHCAVNVGILFYVQQLLAAGATHSLNVQNDDGNTPLHCAVIRGGVCMVKLLLAADAAHSLNVQNNDEDTPFQLALKIDNPRIICAFLSIRAFVQIRDRERGDPIPLHYAIREYSMEKIDALANAMFI